MSSGLRGQVRGRARCGVLGRSLGTGGSGRGASRTATGEQLQHVTLYEWRICELKELQMSR